MLHRLVYVSTVAVAHLPSTVEDILIESVANNTRDGLTGLLVCDGIYFAQALEGEEAAVEDCLARICADDRNREVVVRDRGPAEERLFPRWSMCALYLSDKDDELLAAHDVAISLDDLSPGALWQYLTSLAERCGDELDAKHARLISGSMYW